MLCYKYVSVIVKCGISSSLISNSNVMYYASNPINSWQFSWTHDNSVELVAIQLNSWQFRWTRGNSVELMAIQLNSWQFSWTHGNSVELVAIQLNACQFSWTKQIYKHTELRLITFSKAS